MPIYEYHCEPCQREFELLVRSSSETPRCPSCGSDQVGKLFSVPAAAQTGASLNTLPSACSTGAQAFGCGGGRCMSGMCSTDN